MKYTPGAARCLAFLLVLLAAWSGGRFRAFGLVDANSRANTNAPTDGAPWASMGHVSGGGGTYLGAGWVLTANHLGADKTEFNGTIYPTNGFLVHLTNSTGTIADMVMYQLSSLPPLPKMPLPTATPPAASPVDMIGFGFIAGSAQTNFTNSFGSFTGFYWSTNQLKSWGNNRVNAGLMTVDDGAGTNVSFATDFTAPGPLQTSHEAQVTFGDSGGGVFYKNGSTWEFVGMMFAFESVPDQPDPTKVCVYGQATLSVDIATYRTQILSIISNTPPLFTISRTATNVLVCWGDTGVSYKLLSNTNIATTNWSVINPPLIATNSQFCAQLSATNPATFFRLQKQ